MSISSMPGISTVTSGRCARCVGETRRAQDWMKWLAHASPPSSLSRKGRVEQMDPCSRGVLLAPPAHRPSRRPEPRTRGVQGLLGSGTSKPSRTLALRVAEWNRWLAPSSTR